MRLFKKDGDGDEWTGIKFSTVNNAIRTGGVVSFTYRDPIMANLDVIKVFMNQRVEVRKDDGTTVIWEGVINYAYYHSAMSNWVVSGVTPLRIVSETVCYHNGLLASGIVTAISDPDITDENQTFTTNLQNKYVSFTDITGPSEEIAFPNTDSTFIDNGNPTDTPSCTSYSGTHADLDTIPSTGMGFHDDTSKATDYYGLELVWTVPNAGSSTDVIIEITYEQSGRDYYAENGSDMPLVQIYDDTNATWRSTDASAVGVTGIDRTPAGWEALGGKGNTWRLAVIRITSNFTLYFDGSDKIKIRILMGNSTARDLIRAYHGKLTNKYSATFSDVVSYKIDNAPNASILTCTDDTPNADGVAVGDNFKVGDLLHNIVSEIWTKAVITWTDYSFEAVNLVDATDLRGSFVGTILQRYAEALNWQVWDKIGWEITIDDPAVSTSLSLTEANFEPFTFGADGSSTTRKVISGCQNRFNLEIPSTAKGFPSYGDGLRVDNFYASQSDAALAGATYYTRTSDIDTNFEGTIDLDDGTDYSALELGKLLTVTLYSEAITTFTEQRISYVSYTQDGGGHLYCEVKLS